jgi:predicted nucleic acid-binding Zn ribbon protein
VARDQTRLGDALRAALARLPAGAELANYPIWSDWATLVGPTIARHAQPRRLRRGVLVIAVDGPEWMHELHFMKRELRERLNAHVGRPIIREVFLVLASDDERR